ncbi:LD-carboxypeptidase [Alginatibacterium sediminis]|uniref:LD-carboxypeptidase n=1 Tax=Alginatibacterium sediminis TaxID=2164068 RepID=A0A420EI27_9ALTE|nr:S66 peptidase family protein [Alginatibacterium sediminis]RKF20328.1 LD-carboxypeptidase [Alginatibacterium sediminis]
MKYPKPLKAGSTIAITAFSQGIGPEHEPRFALVCANLKAMGFNIVVGKCLRGQAKQVSAPAAERANELMAFLLDDSIDAIYPPWGGELAIELLPRLDFEKLKQAKPKWILGFSDVSTVAVALCCKLGWASVHCSNLMDLVDASDDPLTRNTLKHLSCETGAEFTQSQSKMHTHAWPDFVSKPEAGYVYTSPSKWRWLTQPKTGGTIDGRLIGGCWDVLKHLFGTQYLDLESLASRYPEGIILYLENAEMSPAELARTIVSMKMRSVFDSINALVLGRSAVSDSDLEDDLRYLDVLQGHLSELKIPILIDVDIGHVPPNLTLINGAFARFELASEALVAQHLI